MRTRPRHALPPRTPAPVRALRAGLAAAVLAAVLLLSAHKTLTLRAAAPVLAATAPLLP